MRDTRTTIRKRGGELVSFDRNKIVIAISKAMKEYYTSEDITEITKMAERIASLVAKDINAITDPDIGVEDVQEIVETRLMQKYPEVAKLYIRYRENRTHIREKNSKLMKQVKSIINCNDIQNSNANIDEYSFSARKNESANVMQKELALSEYIIDDIADAHREGRLYIHDLSEYTVGEHNCLFADVATLLHNGFTARNGDVRPASRFSTACQLLAVIFQIQSQCQFGGVASAHIDRDLAPFVRRSFIKHYKDGLTWFGYDGHDNIDDLVSAYPLISNILKTASIGAVWNVFEDFNQKAYKYAITKLDEEGLQSTQALFHNLNTLESRAGSQVPFTSINFGLDTSFEGRKVTEWILKASLNGIGKHNQTSIFPISIFMHKKGINDRKGTPNYDLKRLAIQSLTHRIYPNWINCDYESNKADRMPSDYLSTGDIKKLIFHSMTADVDLRFDKMEGSNIDSYVQSNVTLEELLVKLITKDDQYIFPTYELDPESENGRGIQVKDCLYEGAVAIDLRTPEDVTNEFTRVLIRDKSQSYNEYCLHGDDHFTKLNWVIVDFTNGVAFSTESFQYDINDFLVFPNTNGKATFSSHIELSAPEYDYDTEMACMGCRTLLGADIHGMGYKKTGRGNVSPVTINLPFIGIEHGICLREREVPDVEGFFKDLNHMLDLCTKELVERFKYISSQNVRAGSFMYDNGTIADYKASLDAGVVYDSMKHSTNALGYIGLANACYAMFGKYFHEDPEVLEFAKRVVKTISDRAKENTAKYNMNFSAYATPAESACKTLCLKLQNRFGKIYNVCDRQYLTNSHHVPVYATIGMKDKIDIESNFAWMATGGCITYVEAVSGVIKNHKAVENMVNYAMNNTKIPYFAINFPIDTCMKCGYSGVINNKCPVCESEEIKRLRRVTGYLTTDYRKFNSGKYEETNDRERHNF